MKKKKEKKSGKTSLPLSLLFFVFLVFGFFSLSKRDIIRNFSGTLSSDLIQFSKDSRSSAKTSFKELQKEIRDTLQAAHTGYMEKWVRTGGILENILPEELVKKLSSEGRKDTPALLSSGSQGEKKIHR